MSNQKIIIQKIILFGIFLFLILIYVVQANAFVVAQSNSFTPTPTIIPTISPTGTPTPVANITPAPPKDIWDKLSAVSGLISGILVALIGGIAAYLYRERERITSESRDKKELALMELQATQGFFPYLLSENEKEIELAILAISSLGSPRLATQLAAYLQRTGARKAVSKILEVPTPTSEKLSDYVYEKFFVVHDIQPNGDVLYERLIEISSLSDPVYWVQFSIGIIGGDNERDIERLGINVTNPILGQKLNWTIELDKPTKKHILVALDPPASVNRNSSVKLNLNWKGAYKPLVENLHDVGRISLDHYVSQLRLVLIAPEGHKFTSIVLSQKLFSLRISTNEMGRSEAIIEAQNIPPGFYNYEIMCRSI